MKMSVPALSSDCDYAMRRHVAAQVKRFFAGEIKDYSHIYETQTCLQPQCMSEIWQTYLADRDREMPLEMPYYRHNVFMHTIKFPVDVICACDRLMTLSMYIWITHTTCPHRSPIFEAVTGTATICDQPDSHEHHFCLEVNTAYNDKKAAEHKAPEVLLQLANGLIDVGSTLATFVRQRIFDRNVLGIIKKFLVKEPELIYRPYMSLSSIGIPQIPERYRSDFFRKLETDGIMKKLGK